jgi:hypothetical protein
MMINRGKLKKTLLKCHFIHHESEDTWEMNPRL